MRERLIMFIFPFLVIFVLINIVEQENEIKEMEQKYIVETISIGEEIYSNEDITFTLNGISRHDIIITSKTKDGESSEYTYSTRMREFIFLKETTAAIKFKTVNHSKGSITFYLDEQSNAELSSE